MSLTTESTLVGLIGDGITHSLSPYMHEAEADAHGLRYIYRPVDLIQQGIPAGKLADLLEHARYFGFNCIVTTHPVKQTVIPLLDRLSPDAAEIGAVNTVILEEDGTTTGHNTDWSGYLWALKRQLPDADLSAVVMLGAGGAGSAVGYALLKHGAVKLTVVDPFSEKAAQLVEQLQSLFPQAQVNAVHPDDIEQVMQDATGLVNASPLGMHMHPELPLPEHYVQPPLWVSDVVYRPVQTQLIQLAEQRGCQTMHGGYMAVGQAIDGFKVITGIDGDGARMMAHFEQMIAEGR